MATSEEVETRALPTNLPLEASVFFVGGLTLCQSLLSLICIVPLIKDS